jgi:hypothetical protein
MLLCPIVSQLDADRAARIQQNQLRLAVLQIPEAAAQLKSSLVRAKAAGQVRIKGQEPTRRSSRVSSRAAQCTSVVDMSACPKVAKWITHLERSFSGWDDGEAEEWAVLLVSAKIKVDDVQLGTVTDNTLKQRLQSAAAAAGDQRVVDDVEVSRILLV